MKESERQAVREAIDAPEAVQLVRLRHATTTNNNDNNNDANTAAGDLAVANIHVTWSQLKYPALQALQVRTRYLLYRANNSVVKECFRDVRYDIGFRKLRLDYDVVIDHDMTFLF